MCSTEALGYAMQVLDVIVLPMSITGRYTPPSGSTSSIRITRTTWSPVQRRWGQELLVLPLGEHCGSGKDAGLHADMWSPTGRPSWTPRTSCSGHVVRGHSNSETNRLGRR